MSCSVCGTVMSQILSLDLLTKEKPSKNVFSFEIPPSLTQYPHNVKFSYLIKTFNQNV